jgi:TolA-binding protein
MLNKYLLSLLFLGSIFAKEVSVFDAGNINISEPYGLTQSEQASYNNKKKLEELNRKYIKLKTSYEDLSQKLQGISSVYENDSESLSKTKRTISSINNNIEATSLSIDKVKQLTLLNAENIIQLEKRLDDFISVQELNNKKVTDLVNKINKNYVTNQQFDELVKFVNKNKSLKKSSKKVVKISNASKFKRAVTMINTRYFTKSIPLWNELLKAKYKPASTNFYLGEARFGKKQYEKAIHHYKTSMLLYDEAKYIPRLLLHSAISFEKTKDTENAINFYSTLVDTYPSSKEAIQAQKQLNKLN